MTYPHLAKRSFGCVCRQHAEPAHAGGIGQRRGLPQSRTHVIRTASGERGKEISVLFTCPTAAQP